MRTFPVLEAALDYARRGWPVFPAWWPQNGKCACGKADCQHPAKHPIGKLAPNGRNSATTGPDVIREWWRQCPEANIAICTGPESGLVVVDIDPRNGGDQSLVPVLARLDPLRTDGHLENIEELLGKKRKRMLTTLRNQIKTARQEMKKTPPGSSPRLIPRRGIENLEAPGRTPGPMS